MFVGSMKKSLEAMEKDIKEYDSVDKVMLEVLLDAHFERLRCDSGNLNQVLENNRIALDIFIEGIEIDKQAKTDQEKSYPCLSSTKKKPCYGTVRLVDGKYICDKCGREFSEWSLENAERWRRGDYHDYVQSARAESGGMRND